MIYRVSGNLGRVVLIFFLKCSPFIDNLQILDPFNLNALNLLKPRGIKSIIGTGIFIRLYYINEKKLVSNLNMLVLWGLNLEEKI